MKYYLKIQALIIHRTIRDTGIPPLLLYIVALIAFPYLTVQLFNKSSLAPFLVAGLSIYNILLLNQIDRNNFIKINFRKSFYRIRRVENLIITLPFLLILLVYRQWYLALLCLVSVVTIPMLKPLKPYSKTLVTPFSKRPFEFVTGTRQYFLIVIGCYLLLGIAIYYNNYNLGMFSIFGLYGTCMLFYNMPESKYLVWNYAKTPGGFLVMKCLIALQNAFIITIPAIILTAVCFQVYGKTILLALLANLFLVNMVLLKYSAFPGQPNIVNVIMFALCLYFPPLLLILIPYNFYIAGIKLKTIL